MHRCRERIATEVLKQTSCPPLALSGRSVRIVRRLLMTLNGHAANARSAVIPLAVTSLGLSLVGVFVYDFIGSFDTRKQ
jgi:hypothetical protein